MLEFDHACRLFYRYGNKEADLTPCCACIPADLWTEGRTAPNGPVSAKLWASWATLIGGSGARKAGFLSDHILTANLRHALQITQKKKMMKRSMWHHVAFFYSQLGSLHLSLCNPVFQHKSLGGEQKKKGWRARPWISAISDSSFTWGKMTELHLWHHQHIRFTY